ncbi:aldose epimerase [Geminisphaera colitermitum]|uniref:aldose epimerase family protein n=1 Tax=Geminisphaera colitermitum TaxID=1148786 RepID=UPI000158CF03|nr:aldose epimerase [Geminisphaera colitermitum]
MEQVPYLGQTLRRWSVGQSTFLAIPERGARLMHWCVTLGDGSVRDVLYWPEITSLDGFHSVRGGNPILFPFNARSFDAGDIHFWRSPDGQRRAMPMHGFARQGRFEVTRMDERGFMATLVPDAHAKECYPFSYEFTVVYRFLSLGLTCEFILKNTGQVPIPWSAGHHFYFTLPWEEGHRREDYRIKIPATKVRRQDAKGHLVPGPALRQEESFGNPELSDAIHSGLKSNTVTFFPVGGGAGVSVKNGLDPVPHPEMAVVTWSADADAPYYCVEPWMGPPNAPETKVGLHWVAPGKSQSYVVEVALTSS